MQKGLIILAHGSPRAEANEEFIAFVEKVRQRDPSHGVQHAFLGSSKPSLEEAIDQMVEKGVLRLTVLPYFLNAGNHVAVDIPAIMEKKQSEHPNVVMIIKPYIGASPEMVNVILKMLH